MCGHHFVGLCECRFKNRVGSAGLHGTKHVGHIDLKNNVHTAFEVKTEAYAPFAYVVESVVAHIHFFLAERVHVVLVGLIVGCVVVVARFLKCIGGCLALVLVRYVGEREVEKTHEHQENSDYTGNDAAQFSFALHVINMVKLLIKIFQVLIWLANIVKIIHSHRIAASIFYFTHNRER